MCALRRSRNGVNHAENPTAIFETFVILLTNFFFISAAGSSCPANSSAGNVSIAKWELTVDLAADLLDAQATTQPCFSAHQGYEGDLVISCSDGVVNVDAIACWRARCRLPNHFVRPNRNLTTAEVYVPDIPLDVGAPLWTDLAGLSDGRFIAAPAFNEIRAALEIGPSGSVRTFGNLAASSLPLKFLTTVSTSNGSVAYGLPYFANQVIRIDADADTIIEIGTEFGLGKGKWLGGAFAGGFAWGIPFNSDQVLRIDPTTDVVSLVGLGLNGFGENKWWSTTVSGTKVIGTPCDATEVLFIDAATGEIDTFGGPLQASEEKWLGSVSVPGTTTVYLIPYSHNRVLKIVLDEVPANNQAFEIGPDLGSGEAKWRSAVLAGDRSIFGIPYSAEHVIRVDVDTDEVHLFGSVPQGPYKWSFGALMPDGYILGVPGLRSDIISIDPFSQVVKIVSAGLEDWESVKDKYNGFVVGSDGRAFAVPGEATKVLAVGDEMCLESPPVSGTVWTCTMGQECSVSINVPNINIATNQLVAFESGQCGYGPMQVAIFEDWNNPAAVHVSGPFVFGAAVSGSPLRFGDYRLCWSDDPGKLSDFSVEIGFLTVFGPSQYNATCVLGMPCVVGISGRGLLASDRLAIAATASKGKPAVFVQVAGLINPASGSTSTLFDLGVPEEVRDGIYELRWGRDVDNDMLTRVGNFVLIGPKWIGELSFPLGMDFAIELEGTGFHADDILAFPWQQTACGDGFEPELFVRFPGGCSELTGVCSSGNVNALGTTQNFPIGTGARIPTIGSNKSGLRQPARLPICWRSGTTTSSTANAQVLFINLGTVTITGPFGLTSETSIATCQLGVSCSLSVQGHGLLLTDILAVLVDGTCRVPAGEFGVGGSGFLADLGFLENPTAAALNVEGENGNKSSIIFDFGVPQHADSRGSILRLCWERADARERGAGAVEVSLLEILPNDCAVLEVENARTPSCKEGGAVAHGHVCTPHCDNGYSPLGAVSLSCSAGEFNAAFQCVQTCLDAPVVASADAQSQCSGLLHGNICNITCPTGHVRSGDFECFDGRLIHLPNSALSPDLLFSVPRCYKPCLQGAFPNPSVGKIENLVCSGGNGPVPHGGQCVIHCGNGRNCFLSGTKSSISSLRCLDGAFETATVACYASCSAANIPHALNLDLCDETPHGSSCELRCKSGYSKSSDLYCEDGVFNNVECRAACDLEQLWPAKPPHFNEEMCVGVGRPRLLSHEMTCTPSCQHGHSNTYETEYPVCSYGVLTPPSVQCYSDCLEPPDHYLIPGAIGLSDVCGSLRHGEECPLLCAPGYTVSGNIRCDNGNFVAGTCVKKCQQLPDVVGAISVDHCYGTPHGQACEIQCKEDWTWWEHTICRNGTWEGVNGCLSPCSSDEVQAKAHGSAKPCKEGGVMRHDSTCTFQCDYGYNTVDKGTCNNGTLTPNAYTCEPMPEYVCGPASVLGVSPEDAARCSGTSHSEKCMFFCQPEYVQVSHHLICNHGKWNKPCVDDRFRCDYYPIIENGRFAAGCANLEGSICKLECVDGFTPGKDAYAKCEYDNGWVVSGKCIRSECGLPDFEGNFVQKCNGDVNADSCSIQCYTGYGPNGYLWCEADVDGKIEWAARDDGGNEWFTKRGLLETGLCLPLPCRTAPVVQGISIHNCDSTPHGGICAAFSCESSLKPTGLYRCDMGKFIEVPVCLADEGAGFESRPAVVFRVGTQLTASWNLQYKPSYGDMVKAILETAFTSAVIAETDLAKIVALGWSTQSSSQPANNQESPGGQAGRRLEFAGIHQHYVLAAIATNRSETNAGTELMLRISTRITDLRVEDFNIVIDQMEKPEPLASMIELGLLSIETPSITRIEQAKKKTTLPPSSTTTRTTTALLTTTTTTTTAYKESFLDSTKRILGSSTFVIAFGMIVVFASIICVACLWLRRRNARLIAIIEALPRTFKRKRKSFVRNYKRTQVPSTTRNMEDLVVQAIQDKGKNAFDLVKIKAAPRKGEGIKIIPKSDTLGPSLDEVLSMSMDICAQNAKQMHDVVEHQTSLAEMVRDRDVPADISFFLRSQAQFHHISDINDDLLTVGGENSLEDKDWLEIHRQIRDDAKIAASEVLDTSGTAVVEQAMVAGVSQTSEAPAVETAEKNSEGHERWEHRQWRVAEDESGPQRLLDQPGQSLRENGLAPTGRPANVRSIQGSLKSSCKKKYTTPYFHDFGHKIIRASIEPKQSGNVT